jgi:hypothetical protein
MYPRWAFLKIVDKVWLEELKTAPGSLDVLPIRALRYARNANIHILPGGALALSSSTSGTLGSAGAAVHRLGQSY